MLPQAVAWLAQAWTGAGPGRALYTAAKTALASLLRSLQGEVEGVRFLVVYPMGTLDTEANRKAMPEADFSRWIAPELVAKVVVELVLLVEML